MLGIHEVQEKVIDFFASELGASQETLHFIKLAKAENGWETKVEVTEQNQYMKKLGYPVIFDKNIYTVTLGEDLSIMGYALSATHERSYATEQREEL